MPVKTVSNLGFRESRKRNDPWGFFELVSEFTPAILVKTPI